MQIFAIEPEENCRIAVGEAVRVDTGDIRGTFTVRDISPTSFGNGIEVLIELNWERQKEAWIDMGQVKF